MVRLPRTAGSSTTFSPLISWINRKKTFRSTSFKFTEIGSPVYLALVEETDACEFATVDAAFPDCCCAACCGVGRAGSVLPPNDARTTEGWVSSPGNAKRGAEILRSFAEGVAALCGPETS